MAKELTDSMELTEGLAICPGRLAKENRLKTLFVKGVVVYLLVMGVMGSYLSALDVECFWLVMNVIVFLCSLYCASLYYSKFHCSDIEELRRALALILAMPLSVRLNDQQTVYLKNSYPFLRTYLSIENEDSGIQVVMRENG